MSDSTQPETQVNLNTERLKQLLEIAFGEGTLNHKIYHGLKELKHREETIQKLLDIAFNGGDFDE